MANPHPKTENLTRAGKGQPRKGLCRTNYTLTPELVNRLKAIAQQQGWKENYTVENALRSILGLDSDYDEADFALIREGKIVE